MGSTGRDRPRVGPPHDQPTMGLADSVLRPDLNCSELRGRGPALDVKSRRGRSSVHRGMSIRPMTAWGQTEKSSRRANVFRSAPNIGHSSASLIGLFGADCVAKRFCASERARLIQDQAPMRNVDSGIPSLRFDCCVFLFYSFSEATFATKSARSCLCAMSVQVSLTGVKRTRYARVEFFSV